LVAFISLTTDLNLKAFPTSSKYSQFLLNAAISSKDDSKLFMAICFDFPDVIILVFSFSSEFISFLIFSYLG